MKVKYQKILLESASMIGRIPGVSITGATATDATYVSAYRDYYESCQCLGVIANNIDLIEKTEAAINKNKDKYDMSELESGLETYSKQIDKAYNNLKEYILQREKEHWK